MSDPNAAFASYVLSDNWTGELKSEVIGWVQKKLTEIQGESEENDVFIEYICTLIEHHKSMVEIASDLKDFFGEDQSKLFSNALGKLLSDLSTNPGSGSASEQIASKSQASSTAADAAPTERRINLKASSSRFDNVRPLTTSREPSSRSNNSGRLLQTALSSSRDTPHDATTKKRSADNLEGTERKRKQENGRDESTNTKRQQRYENKRDSELPVPPTSRLVGRLGGVPDSQKFQKSEQSEHSVNSVLSDQTLQQMQMMATMLGFSSVEEMVRFQQQTMMQAMTSAMVGGSGSAMNTPYIIPNSMPMNSRAPPKYNGRGSGRFNTSFNPGRGGGKPLPPTTPMPPKSQPQQPTPPLPPSHDVVSQNASVESSGHENPESLEDRNASHSSFRGRGVLGRRGRGSFGRASIQHRFETAPGGSSIESGESATNSTSAAPSANGGERESIGGQDAPTPNSVDGRGRGDGTSRGRGYLGGRRGRGMVGRTSIQYRAPDTAAHVPHQGVGAQSKSPVARIPNKTWVRDASADVPAANGQL